MAELIPLIRVELLSVRRMKYLLKRKRRNVVPMGSQVRKRIRNALRNRKSPDYASYCHNLRRYTKIRPVFVGFGGFTNDDAEALGMECWIHREFSWSSMIPVRVQPGRSVWPSSAMSPFFNGIELAAVTWDQLKIYVIGRDHSFECYNHRDNTWRRLKYKLPASTDAYGAAMWEERVYVTGLGEDDSLILHVFNTKKRNGWRALQKLEKTPRSHHCLLAAHGYLYVIGGYEDMSVDRASARMFRYNIIGQVWEEMPAMKHPRARMAAAVVEDVIYVFGGVHEHEEYRTCEKYNLLARRWESVREMDHSRSCFSAVSHGGRIYSLGGVNNKRILPAFDMYNPVTDRWHSLPPMKIPRRNLGVAVLLLPEENPEAI